MKENKIFSRITSFLLAIVMVFSILTVMPQKVSAADASFNSKSTVTITDDQAWDLTGQYNWVKYKAPADGYLTVTAQYATAYFTASEGNFQLFASNKKTQLSTNQGYSTASEYFPPNNSYGMKKGTTYYLRVQSVGGVALKSKFVKVKESSGSSKTKAKTIKSGKTVKGIVQAGSKTQDWYKFKLPKKQYVNIAFSGVTNEKLKLTIYEGKKGYSPLYINKGDTKTRKIYMANAYTNKKIKIDAGTTFYVKVERSSKTSSGYYTLKWY